MDAAQDEPLSRPTSATWVVVALSGELDFASAGALAVLDEAVREHPRAHVLVDLSHVTFLDSAALVAFARARQRAEAAGGRLSLYAASAFARRLLEIWHLEPVREGTCGGDAA
jgi:anti-sigma B factor antagonist